jgi:hypothetical protein
MKSTIIKIIIILFLMSLGSFGVASPPPPPPQEHGSSGNQCPFQGGAPIGSGLFILLGLGAMYGGRKLYYEIKNFRRD